MSPNALHGDPDRVRHSRLPHCRIYRRRATAGSPAARRSASSAERPRESSHFTPNRNCAGSRPDREQGARVSVCSQDTLSRSSPRGAPRDARVAGTPLRGPSAWPWIPAISAFTRVHSPSKTGVNALNDALCAGMSGVLLQHKDLRPWCVPAKLRPSGELEPLVQRRVTAHRRGHQKAIALAEDALDVVGIDVGVADDHVVPLAGVDHPRHPFEHLGMLVLAGIAELLGEIALADEDR